MEAEDDTENENLVRSLLEKKKFVRDTKWLSVSSSLAGEETCEKENVCSFEWCPRKGKKSASYGLHCRLRRRKLGEAKTP